jgi:hypothetical protein
VSTYCPRGFFNEAEVELARVEEEEISTTTVVKKKPVRNKLPKDLSRETVIHDIEDKHCTCCGHELHQMSDERSENRLFSNTANGARANAMLYSIIETAKANGLIPFDYIAHCLEQQSSDVDEKTTESMLPRNVRLA